MDVWVSEHPSSSRRYHFQLVHISSCLLFHKVKPGVSEPSQINLWTLWCQVEGIFRLQRVCRSLRELRSLFIECWFPKILVQSPEQWYEKEWRVLQIRIRLWARSSRNREESHRRRVYYERERHSDQGYEEKLYSKRWVQLHKDECTTQWAIT